jgi:hypothetical protein
MTRLQIALQYADGTGTVVGSEPATARGRRAIDQQAWALLERPGVVQVAVDPVDRVAADKGKGRYR